MIASATASALFAVSGAPRILVVDQSSFFRHLLRPLLIGAGYDVVTAATATAALRLRDAGEAVDVVVLASERQGDQGARFTRACRRAGAWRSVPIVALTTRVSEPALAWGRDLGFTEHLEKLDQEALFAAIRRCLDGSSKRSADERSLSAAIA